VLAPFEEVIPLKVYGLPAGTYTVEVNGVQGTFGLEIDNILSL
jgi:inhibitor of cysteine peptidase